MASETIEDLKQGVEHWKGEAEYQKKKLKVVFTQLEFARKSFGSILLINFFVVFLIMVIARWYRNIGEIVLPFYAAGLFMTWHNLNDRIDKEGRIAKAEIDK